MITIWHNQKCSKSREAISLVGELEYEVVKYLEDNITKEDLLDLLKKLSIGPRELMRTKEEIYKELDLANELDDEKLIEAMLKYPKLIERPIIIKGDRAIIGRPSEKILPFLKD